MIMFRWGVKVFAEFGNKNAQDRSDAFMRWFLHTDQSAALLRALKIAIDSAQTLPFGSTPLFTVIDHLHSAKPLVCEVNQPS